MKVIYDIEAIINNIQKARMILGKPVVLMFKDFYDDLAEYLPRKLSDGCWSLNQLDSNCYSLNMVNKLHKGAVVLNVEYAEFLYEEYGIKRFYIPIDCGDSREGLSLNKAFHVASELSKRPWSESHVLITSGCMNSIAPSYEAISEIWRQMSLVSVKGISIGGSFWIGQGVLPDCIEEVRIGEYMLFGTIPYCSDINKLGSNGIEIHTEIIAVYPERRQLIVDCGYKYADLSKCKILDKGLKYVNNSSEYSIFTYSGQIYEVGQILHFIPNYRSLVTLKNARTVYVKNYL